MANSALYMQRQCPFHYYVTTTCIIDIHVNEERTRRQVSANLEDTFCRA